MTAVYLDCNATTPLDPPVKDILFHYLCEEFGNEGSRTHEFGARAKKAVQLARDQVAALADASRDEVVFTSGATESNNMVILGLRDAARRSGKTHFITSQIEHKAVLEPFGELERDGFEVTRLSVGPEGWVSPDDLNQALRPNTFLVSVMHVNNETGVIQPLDDLLEAIDKHETYFHTDAAQGFGKDLETLKNKRIDLISVSGHKLFAPKGVGALIVRKRNTYARPPLTPLYFGGGQERGLRPGTLPVALIAALGEACRLSITNHAIRLQACCDFERRLIQTLLPLGAKIHGDTTRKLANVINISFDGLDSEALMLAVKDVVAISNGSACTSSSYSPSHVLTAMGMTPEQANECVRFSWCHLTPAPDWGLLETRIRSATSQS